jgi:uroporphyrinogen-III synthase
MEHEMLGGKRILLARAAVARDTLPQGLRARRAVVDVVTAYRTVSPEGLGDRAHAILSDTHRPDWITFTSSSTVRNFVEAAGVEALKGMSIASIGPVTSATIREAGLEVAVEATQFDEDGLVKAILAKGIIRA